MPSVSKVATRSPTSARMKIVWNGRAAAGKKDVERRAEGNNGGFCRKALRIALLSFQ
jgi:hypothetical protein